MFFSGFCPKCEGVGRFWPVLTSQTGPFWATWAEWDHLYKRIHHLTRIYWFPLRPSRRGRPPKFRGTHLKFRGHSLLPQIVLGNLAGPFSGIFQGCWFQKCPQGQKYSMYHISRWPRERCQHAAVPQFHSSVRWIYFLGRWVAPQTHAYSESLQKELARSSSTLTWPYIALECCQQTRGLSHHATTWASLYNSINHTHTHTFSLSPCSPNQ